MERYHKHNSDMQIEIESLHMELLTRPTLRQWSIFHKRLKETELQLMRMHRLQEADNMAGNGMGRNMYLSTRDLIRADKKNYYDKQQTKYNQKRQQPDSLTFDNLSKVKAIQILSAVCNSLDTTDVTDVISHIEKLKMVVRLIPRLENFVTDICKYIVNEIKNEKITSINNVNSNDRGVSYGNEEDMIEEGLGEGVGIGEDRVGDDEKKDILSTFVMEDAVKIIKRLLSFNSFILCIIFMYL